MSKELGINVKVEFPTLAELQTDFESKLGNKSLKVKAELDFGDQLGKDLSKKISNTIKKASSEINQSLKNGFTPANNGSLLGDAASKTSKELKSIQDDASSTQTSLNRLAKVDISNGVKETKDALNQTAKVADEVNNIEKKSIMTAREKQGILKQIASITKEIGGLESASYGKDGKTQDAIKQRVRDLESLKKTLQDDYLKASGSDSANTSIVKNAESMAQFSKSLARANAESKELEESGKEMDSRLKRVMEIEKERYALSKKLVSAKGEEAKELAKQEQSLREYSKSMAEYYQFDKKASAGSMAKYNNLVDKGDRNVSLAKARQIDKENELLEKQISLKKRAAKEESNKAYTELKSDLKDIYSLKSKIHDLEAKAETGKDSTASIKLDGLKKELEIREQMYNLKRKEVNESGSLNSDDAKRLSELKKEYDIQERINSVKRESRSKQEQSNESYKELLGILKRIDDLNDKMSSADRHEAQAIREIVDAERERYNLVKKTANLNEKLSREHREQLELQEQQSNENRRNNRHIQRGTQLDKDMSRYSLQEMFNPRQIFGDARQAFTEILESVGRVDEQIVNIAKVADEPASKIKEFSDNIFEYASKFGVSADGYAEAVGKWITTGKSLDESVELANASVMGSFVGNISEDEMVKYMAVPLNSYKKEALEATDVINAMNEVSNKNAIEMNDLGSAYERSAATAAQAGTSFSELTGMITAAQEATRAGGEKIGTALKAMDVNFGKISSKLTKGDEAKFNFFKDMGVNITDGNNQLRSTYDILNDLSKVWDQLSATDQSTAGSYIAGKNHSAVFSGLMANWETVQKAKAEAQGQLDLVNKESGSAFQEFEKQQESVAYHLSQLKNAWDEMLNTISGGKGGVNPILDGLASGLRKVTELAKDPNIRKFGEGFIKATAVMTATTAFSKFFTVITGGTRSAISGFASLAKSILKLTPILTKTGREARRAKKMAMEGNMAHNAGKTASNAGKALETAGDIAGSGSGWLKAARGMSKVMSIGGKLIPVVGGIISIMEILEASGFDVWGGLGKLIGKTLDKTKEVKKATEEYVDATKKAKEESEENFVLNGGSQKAKQKIANYEELIKGKKEQAQKNKENGNGDGSFVLSKEEFAATRKNIQETAKDLGVNIDVEVNNLEDIDKAIAKLKELKKERDATDGKKAINLMGDAHTDKIDKVKEAVEKKKQEKIDELEAAKKHAEEVASRSKGKMGWASKGNANKANELQQEIDEIKKSYNPKDFKDVIAARQQVLEDFNKQKQTLTQSLSDGTLNDAFANSDKNGQGAMIALLGQQLPLYEKRAKLVNETNESVKKGNDLTTEQMKLLSQYDPESFNGLDNRISKWDDDTKAKALSLLAEKSKEANGQLARTKEVVDELAKHTDINVADVMEKAAKGGADFVNEMLKLGDAGANILGVTGTFMTATDDWQASLRDIQAQLDQIPEEKKVKFGLVNENGVLNFEAADKLFGLPDEIKTKWKLVKEDGNLNIEEITKTLDLLNSQNPETEWKFDYDHDKVVTAEELAKGLSEKNGEEILMQLKVEKDEEAKKLLENEEQEKIKKDVEVNADTSKASSDIDDLLNGKDGFKAIPVDADTREAQASIDKLEKSDKKVDIKVSADTKDADSKIDKTVAKTEKGGKGKVKLTGDTKDADDKVDSSVAKAKKGGSGVISLTGTLDSIVSWFMNLGSGTTKSVGVNIKGSKSKSVSTNAINPALGKSMSSKVGSNISQSKSSKSKSYKSDKKPEKIDEDVWRYWAKELFKGVPLERSMDNLANSIKEAKDNQDRLIPLYKQQIDLLSKQEAYFKDMRNAKQSELNSVLGKLRGKGFKTRGNEITNLDRAKAFSGDEVSEVNESLRKYKDLYKSLDDFTGKINSINISKLGAKENIKNAEIKKELKELEKTLKRIEAVATSIKHRTDLANRKDQLVSDKDVELKMTVSEEGLNTASDGVSELIKQFNALSVVNIQHSENAEKVKSKLESLKSEILDNANAIKTYRDALQNLKLNRMKNDFHAFTESVDKNISYLQNNIDTLKDKMINGLQFSDLASTTFDMISFDRRTALEQEKVDRLKLEAELNEALDGFAKKNIDRTAKVANAVLTIEKDKYGALLKMQSDYSNGNVANYNVNAPDVAIGATSAKGMEREYSDWLDKMKFFNEKYSSEFNKMKSNYESLIRSTTNSQRKQQINNGFILGQMKLQEKMYKDLMAMNNESIKRTENELKNSRLTTEQRKDLEKSLLEYKQDNIKAQNSIAESVKKRYEFEFSLLDKLREKADKNSQIFEHMIDLYRNGNANPTLLAKPLGHALNAKIAEYLNAKKEIQTLLAEQGTLSNGSVEWRMIDDRLKATKKSLQQLTADLMNANKAVLDNQIAIYQDQIEKDLLGGFDMERYKKSRELWLTGVSRELELEKLRLKAKELDDKQYLKKLALLDRQEKLSKKDLDNLDKQMKIAELQEKLSNLENERNVQTLVRKDDGTWGWDYVTDMTEYDKTKSELLDAEKDLEEFKESQRESYVSDLMAIINKAKSGDYRYINDLKGDIETLKEAYGDVLKGIPNIDMSYENISDVVSAYEKFLSNKWDILGQAFRDNSGDIREAISSSQGVFETAFRNSAYDVGKVIGDQIKDAFKVSGKPSGAIENYVIQSQELVFPNATDTQGIKDVFLSLPEITKQRVRSK